MYEAGKCRKFLPISPEPSMVITKGLPPVLPHNVQIGVKILYLKPLLRPQVYDKHFYNLLVYFNAHSIVYDLA